MRYDEPDSPYGNWHGLHAACAAAGWSLVLRLPPREAERYEARRGEWVWTFYSRDEVCDWLDRGAPYPVPMAA